MASTLTLLNVRTSVREHIDEPTAGYWTDSELNDYISKAELALWRKILALKHDYFLSSTGFTLSTVVGQYKYSVANGGIPALNADIWRVTAIRTTSTGYQDINWVPADPNSGLFIDGLRTDVPIVYPFSFMYAVRNISEIWISPLPQAIYTAQVDYIQQPTPQTADSDTFLLPDAFLTWVEYIASARALRKGPVGDYEGWLNDAKQEWSEIVEALDTPRSNQGPDCVIGFAEDYW